MFGIHLENKLAEVDNGKKSDAQKAMTRNMIMQQYLGSGSFATPGR